MWIEKLKKKEFEKNQISSEIKTKKKLFLLKLLLPKKSYWKLNILSADSWKMWFGENVFCSEK